MFLKERKIACVKRMRKAKLSFKIKSMKTVKHTVSLVSLHGNLIFTHKVDFILPNKLEHTDVC